MNAGMLKHFHNVILTCTSVLYRVPAGGDVAPVNEREVGGAPARQKGVGLQSPPT